MTPDIPLIAWQERNREYLAGAVDDLHARMVGEDRATPRRELEALADGMDSPPALRRLCEVFGLGAFERDVVLMCLGWEMDPRFRVDPLPVTVGRALEAVDGANWAALDAAAPLRGSGIVVLGAAEALADAPLRLAEDVVRFLMGFDPLAEPNAELQRVPDPPVLVGSQRTLGDELARAVSWSWEVTGSAPAIELHGSVEEDRMVVATACAAALGATVATARVGELPPPGDDLRRRLQTWSRGARMTSTLLCLSGSDSPDGEPTVRDRLDAALANIPEPFVLSFDTPTSADGVRAVVRRRVPELSADERLEVWQACLAKSRGRLRLRRGRALPAALTALAGDFRVGARTVERVCLESEAELAQADAPIAPERLAEALRAGCARAVRARLDPLAERVTLESVGEVALPEAEARQFAELEMTIRLSHEVNVHWGLGHGRATGTTALFAGPSGTGKTHAAYVLAQRLGLDLYRASLASVLSKWIGETEKNLDRIFTAAAIGGVILLFDEADALFGKRSEVRDSHDRYANLSTAYLLSRIENAPTPTILTTNLKEAIDPAFVRRLHFVIDFPFPSDIQRREIWTHVYPERTPVGGIAPERLSVLAASGGTIVNIARRGAFMAAAEPASVQMHHLQDATQRELRKLGRDMTPDELEVWQ